MILNQPFRNPLNYFKILFFTILFLVVLFFVGCKSTAPTTIEKVVEVHTDSIRTTEISKAIQDSLVIKVAKVATAKPECDSITQATLDQVLKQLNFYKKSGNNEFKLGYDAALREIIAVMKIAETKKETTATNKTASTKEIVEVPVNVEVPVKYIPWWVKILAWIGGITFAYLIYRISRIFWAK